ncbi:glycosyltransferase family 4 protein [Noviherbaspirillum massiliense]|uniref:glycosyltransferase family 4 protein n=1 Tax=Noviherbaspirillum massiliense TaxID=1465823 RepID=UPI0002DAAADD|nr:glycosyltransferase family 4 protein [Noviherbaspirillum massiliense]
MKIAQVSPLFESVPPRTYGGTERVVSYLTEELVRLGHDVTLFACGDSVTSARLVAPVSHSVHMDPLPRPWMATHAIELDLVRELAPGFDIIHFHTDILHLPLAMALPVPSVTTTHGRLDFPDLVPLYDRFSNCALVSISDSQRAPLAHANWYATVHHGLPPDLYSFQPEPGEYFLFIGRLSREKGLERAIDIARQCGVPLYIGARVDAYEMEYFHQCIQPLLRDPLVTYVGEVCEREKRELLENARALLFPIDWPEPFGLVMIEAFSCGTPVVAYANGSVPEIVEDGVTGFVVTNQEEAVRAARHIGSIDRRRCREAFERRFTAAHMAQNYLHTYRRIIAQHASRMIKPCLPGNAQVH